MFRIELKRLREDRGLSQYKLAEALGVSQAAVGLWESGKREPNFSTACAIADFFNVSVDRLLGHVSVHVQAAAPKLPAADADLLRKFHALDQQAQARILNSLDFEYHTVAKEKARSSTSPA